MQDWSTEPGSKFRAALMSLHGQSCLMNNNIGIACSVHDVFLQHTLVCSRNHSNAIIVHVASLADSCPLLQNLFMLPVWLGLGECLEKVRSMSLPACHTSLRVLDCPPVEALPHRPFDKMISVSGSNLCYSSGSQA